MDPGTLIPITVGGTGHTPDQRYGGDQRRQGCCQSNGNLSSVWRRRPKPVRGSGQDCAPRGQPEVAAPQGLHRRGLVPGLRDRGFQHFTLMINGALEVVHLAVGLQADFVEAPSSVGLGPHALDPLSADLSGEHRAGPVPRKPHRLVANVDAPLKQQVLDVPRRQRLPNVKEDDQPDYLWQGVKPAKRVGALGHSADLCRAR